MNYTQSNYKTCTKKIFMMRKTKFKEFRNGIVFFKGDVLIAKHKQDTINTILANKMFILCVYKSLHMVA